MNENQNSFFGEDGSKRRLKFVLSFVVLFFTSMIVHTNFEIIKYNELFEYINMFIFVIVPIIFLFFVASDNIRKYRNMNFFIRIYSLLVNSFFGIIFYFVFAYVLIPPILMKVISFFPKHIVTENVKVKSKKITSNHGKHYEISIKSNNLKKEFNFSTSETEYKNLKIGSEIKIKYYETKNKNRYIKYSENPIK